MILMTHISNHFPMGTTLSTPPSLPPSSSCPHLPTCARSLMITSFTGHPTSATCHICYSALGDYGSACGHRCGADPDPRWRCDCRGARHASHAPGCHSAAASAHTGPRAASHPGHALPDAPGPGSVTAAAAAPPGPRDRAVCPAVHPGSAPVAPAVPPHPDCALDPLPGCYAGHAPCRASHAPPLAASAGPSVASLHLQQTLQRERCLPSAQAPHRQPPPPHSRALQCQHPSSLHHASHPHPCCDPGHCYAGSHCRDLPQVQLFPQRLCPGQGPRLRHLWQLLSGLPPSLGSVHRHSHRHWEARLARARRRPLAAAPPPPLHMPALVTRRLTDLNRSQEVADTGKHSRVACTLSFHSFMLHTAVISHASACIKLAVNHGALGNTSRT